MSLKKISKCLFYVLAFLLPLNLGKHYVVKESYVYGMLVDYLIPTIYVQDILVVTILVLWLLSVVRNKGYFRKAFLSRENQIIWLFLFTLFLSVLNSSRFLPSLAAFLRTFIYGVLAMYVGANLNSTRDLWKFIKISFCSLFLVSILGVIQFIKQESVFNNYLFFGEQPYSDAARGITKEYFLGTDLIPPYGLFRHPNAFGGYLLVFLTFLLFYLVPYVFVSSRKSRLQLIFELVKGKSSLYYYFVCFVGFLCFLFTLSVVAYACVIITMLVIILRKTKLKNNLFIILLTIALSLSLPLFRNNSLVSRYASIYRRSDLLESTYVSLKDHWVFGSGYGLSTVYIEQNLETPGAIRFVQPVHNIFMLVLFESGIFALIFLLVILFTGLKKTHKYKNILFVFLVQLIFLGSFDHYFFTIHQTHLLMWILIGWSLIPERFYDYN